MKIKYSSMVVTEKVQEREQVETKQSVKQTFHTSTEVEKRLQLCIKSKGLKGSTICLIALDEYLTKNNF